MTMDVSRESHDVGMAATAPNVRLASEPGLTLPTFRLSTLLTVTAILCVVLALGKVVSPLLSGITLLLFCVVSVHVCGNAVGTKLRQSARHVPPLAHDDAIPNPGSAHEVDLTPQSTRLSQHGQVGWGTTLATLLGALAGGIVGGWVLQVTMQDETASTPAMVLGVVSCALLGAFVCFGICSLLGAVSGAVFEAHQGASVPSGDRTSTTRTRP